MYRKYIIAFILFGLLAFSHGAQAQIVVNEFSQGASGNKEYLEFVVKGQPTCTNSCADLRGWIFDDNNGWYGSVAISPGCYRFKNDPNWACVPYGSIIVVYNSGDVNASLPADDPTDANNDHVYIVPITSTLLELQNSLPNSGSMTYPSSGFGGSTTWTNMALNNSNDVVQTVDPANLTASYHAVSYGSGVSSPVHLSGSGSQKVFYLNDAQYNVSASWIAGNVPANETPGAPNTAANATWINGMLNASGGSGASNNDTTDAAICQGSSYLFNGTGYSVTGYYTDTFTSGGGCDSIVTLNLTVNPIPAAPTVVSPLSYCEEAIAPALIATGASLLWYDVPTGGTGSSIAPSPSTVAAGNYTYYVSQKVLGCESPRAEIKVDIKPKPLPPVVSSSSELICQNAQPIALTAQGQNLLWYNQPLASTGSPVAPVINTSNGHTETWYITQTVNGCESDSALIAVNVSSIHADFTLSVDTLCISDSLSTNNLSLGSNYINHWNFGDGFSYVDLNHTHQYTVPGIYNVTLAITNSDGCVDTARKSIWVSPVPELKVSLDRREICTGDHVVFNLKYMAGFGLFNWNFGDGVGASLDDRDNVQERGNIVQTELRHAYDQPGVFFFTTTVYTPGCEAKNGYDSVNVYALPKVYLGPDTSLCLHGAPILLKNTFGEGLGETYEWSTGETTPEILARHHGDITLTVSTPYCSNSDVIHIAKDCYIDIPNAFTPNGDGENDYFFPRELLSSSVVSFSMQVVNRWGQKIFETTQTNGRGWDGKLNGTDQPGGVYIYIIKVSFINGATEAYQGNVTLLR
jgi:gliding motility-associated-like protein